MWCLPRWYWNQLPTMCAYFQWATTFIPPSKHWNNMTLKWCKTSLAQDGTSHDRLSIRLIRTHQVLSLLSEELLYNECFKPQPQLAKIRTNCKTQFQSPTIPSYVCWAKGTEKPNWLLIGCTQKNLAAAYLNGVCVSFHGPLIIASLKVPQLDRSILSLDFLSLFLKRDLKTCFAASETS